MIEFDIRVSDFDTGELIELSLPCDTLSLKIDKSHDLQIVDWDGDFFLGCYDDIEKINNIVNKINSSNPQITIEDIESIMRDLENVTFCSDSFIEKICENDFMLERLHCGKSKREESAARYLALDLGIQFAKNINMKDFKETAKDNKINWMYVWRHYVKMGFQIITNNSIPMIFNWNSAEI